MRQNKDRFRGPVYEPARLNVFAKTQDRQIVNLVEGPIALNAFKVSSRFLSRYARRS